MLLLLRDGRLLRQVCQEVSMELTSKLNPEKYEEQSRRKHFNWREEQALIRTL